MAAQHLQQPHQSATNIGMQLGPSASPHAQGDELLQDGDALHVERVISLRQRVRRAVDLWHLPQGLREELPVRARSRPVPVAPDREDLQRLRDRRRCLGDGLHLLAEVAGEQDDGAEQYHGPDLLGEELHEGGVERDARALSEADNDDVLPIQRVLRQPRLQRLHEGAAEQLHVVEQVEVLVLEAGAVPQVPRPIHDLRRLQVELQVGLAGGVLRPGHGQHAAVADGRREVLQHGVLGLGVVPDKDEEVRRRLQVAALVGHRQRPLGAHRRDGLLREEEVQPLRLQLVPLLLLLAPLGLLLLGLDLALLLLALLLGGCVQLLLQGREDEHHLRAVCRVRGAGEGVRDRILADLVQHGVHEELVRADQLRHVLHDRHHLLLVRGQGVDPPRDVEAVDLPAPCREQARGDLDGASGAVAVDDDLRILVA
mmetsp:Transcript_66469/g.185775  ORF Transcript_66469/g.185775 Transcript_66469/m.185775 type:complete len:427 (+) Transcript_66469:132-1412(+)